MAITSIGEILPEIIETFDNLKLEKIPDVDKPLYDGGSRTIDPYHRRRGLPNVSAPSDPRDAVIGMVDLTLKTKELSDNIEELRGKTLTDEELDQLAEREPPEDYAQNCRKGFADAAWQAFKSHDGSYAEKAKAAKESLRSCWKETWKHITAPIRDAFSVDNVIEDN